MQMKSRNVPPRKPIHQALHMCWLQKLWPAAGGGGGGGKLIGCIKHSSLSFVW